MSTARIALLIDAENIGADRFPAIMELAGRFGQPVIKRLFGLRKGWEAIARASALKVEWQASGGKGKNTVDIAMTVHAMDIVHRGLVDAICLVSSDCDFQPLAIHLREAGVTVYGIGEAKTDKSLRIAYAAFHLLPDVKVPKAGAKTTTPQPGQPDHRHDAIIIIGLLPRDGAWIRLQALGSELSRKHPDISATLKNGRLAKLVRAIDNVKQRGSGTEIEFRLGTG